MTDKVLTRGLAQVGVSWTIVGDVSDIIGSVADAMVVAPELLPPGSGLLADYKGRLPYRLVRTDQLAHQLEYGHSATR